MIDTVKLRELLERATKGPWIAKGHPESFKADAVFSGEGRKIAYFQAMFGRPHVGAGEIEANAVLVAKAITQLPALLDTIDAMQGEGWKLVPVEPTPEMLDRFVSRALCVSVAGDGGWSNYAREQWATMLAASPSDPTIRHRGRG